MQFLAPLLQPVLAHQDLYVDQLSRFGERFTESDFFVGWGTLALINAGLAQGKNRSGFAWFVLSIFFGPIATFVLVAFCDKLSFYEED